MKTPDRTRAEGLPSSIPSDIDLVCYSHLRWDFVFQRPQHLLIRHGRHRTVHYIEEPEFSQRPDRPFRVVPGADGVIRVTPLLKSGMSDALTELEMRMRVDDYFAYAGIDRHIAWYYTPMALAYTDHREPEVMVYDCMDELTGFAGASHRLRLLERRLLRHADVVFTGGRSLYEAKRDKHPAVFAFPSSIDRAHFGAARLEPSDPVDQAALPHPRLGFYGVIDERMDVDLVRDVADLRPDWHLVIIGPVAKRDPATLPMRENIHYLGMKAYEELPSYLGNWDVAIMPFARNESTRFISPTKTPEYLAGGVPVVSTSIRDVVDPYAKRGLIHVADAGEEFVSAVERALEQRRDRAWLADVDHHLSRGSWDNTWRRMNDLMAAAYHSKRAVRPEPALVGAM